MVFLKKLFYLLLHSNFKIAASIFGNKGGKVQELNSREELDNDNFEEVNNMLLQDDLENIKALVDGEYEDAIVIHEDDRATVSSEWTETTTSQVSMDDATSELSLRDGHLLDRKLLM